jgi:hypothetical protein
MTGLQDRGVDMFRARKTSSSGVRSSKGVEGKGPLIRRGGLAAGLMALVVSLSACSGAEQNSDASAKAPAPVTSSVSPSTPRSDPPSTSPAAVPSKKPSPEATLSSYTDWNLQKARADALSHHVKSVSYRDASELGRTVAHTDNWKVCAQTPSAGVYSTSTELTFKIVEVGESCSNPPRASSSSASNSGRNTSGRDTSGGNTSGGSSTKKQLCSIRSNAGNCYQAGQFCRTTDVGATTTNAAGREITCGYESGANRWHY